MRLASLLLLALAAGATLAGCSSSSGNGPSPDGGSEASTQHPDAGDAGGSGDAAQSQDAAGEAAAQACNTLANVAQPVTTEQVAQDPPQPTGGTIADGTYTMTAVTIYTGAAGPSGPSGTSQITVQIAGSTIQVVSAGQPSTQTVTLATSGTSLTATDTCPDANVTHGSYSATATTLMVFLDGGTDDAGARTVVESFTKQ